MKSKAPFFSLNPSGSFAKTLVASKHKGVNYVSITHKPNKTMSSIQSARRKLYRAGCVAWKALTSEQKEDFKVLGNLTTNGRITGFNLFMRNYLGVSVDNAIWLENGDFMLLENTGYILLDI